jgi:hypothetical protein
MTGDGFAIEGGQGYIVNSMKDGVVSFIGAAWTNDPPIHPAPPITVKSNSAWAFVVSGNLDMTSDNSTMYNPQFYNVTVKNLRTNAVSDYQITGDGSFAAAFADLNRNPVIQAGDSLEIVVKDAAGKVVSGPVISQIDTGDISKAFTDVTMRFGHITPKNSVLLQNYPNPFNPETWIPFQLSESADVSVGIYDSTGKLVRVLDLGHKDAGIYTNKQESLYWDGKNSSGEQLASGIYFYTLRAGNFVSTRKMTILK